MKKKKQTKKQLTKVQRERKLKKDKELALFLKNKKERIEFIESLRKKIWNEQ